MISTPIARRLQHKCRRKDCWNWKMYSKYQLGYIVGLSQVRRDGKTTLEREDCMFNYFGTTQGQYGVGFLVSKKWQANIIEGYSERVAVLKFKLTHNKSLTIFQTYALTSLHTDDEVEEFYDTLNEAYDECKGTWSIIIGDFNAKIGTRQQLDRTDIIGPYELGNRNEHGTHLIQFASRQRLSNTFFYKKNLGVVGHGTLQNLDGRTKKRN